MTDIGQRLEIKPTIVNEKIITAKSANTVVIKPIAKRVVQDVDYIAIYQKNKLVGLNGEFWVLDYERDRLKKLGINFEVEHTAKIRGDGCGFDILSVEDDGVTDRYIEVKTTTSADEHHPFFFSDNELEFSQQHRSHYYLYRVYDFKPDTKAASITIKPGGLDELNARPISYNASI